MYNQSAGSDSHNSSRAYAESEMLYLSKWYGRFTARLLKRMERPRRVRGAARIDGWIPIDTQNALVEASPLPSFDTAAGHFAASQSVALPDEVWDSYLPSILYVRVISRLSRQVVGTWAKVRT